MGSVVPSTDDCLDVDEQISETTEGAGNDHSVLFLISSVARPAPSNAASSTIKCDVLHNQAFRLCVSRTRTLCSTLTLSLSYFQDSLDNLSPWRLLGPLKVHCHISSETGLSSVTSIVIGSKAAIIIDPPFLIGDANSIVEQTKSLTSNPVVAVFVTHHHPDHYFSANPILDAFPEAKFYAAPYVRTRIDREYDEKVVYWPKVFGRENIPVSPQRPEPYNYSFFILEGNEASPVCLLGPVQGDGVDHTLFWLPVEKTLIAGDAVYARSTHAWVEEIETPDILHAWDLTLQFIKALGPT